MKKNKLLVTYICIVVACGILFTIRHHQTNRLPASTDTSGDKMEPSKSLIVYNLKWSDNGQSSRISFYEDQLNLCETWTSMQVTFRAEGIAYSGEPSRVVQTSGCEDRGFYQDWPRDLMSDDPNLQKIGLFDEVPPEWAIETVKLMGPQGTVSVSGPELYQRTGRIFTIEP